MSTALRPHLRAVETIVVPDPRLGKVLVLRDTQGVASGHARIPPGLVPVVARFTGEHTCEEIAREVTREAREEVPVELVQRIADELEKAFFLYGPTFDRARAATERAFADLDVRPASHAGGAYHDDPAALRAYLDAECLAHGAGTRAVEHAKSSKQATATKSEKTDKEHDPRPIVGLVAPHIDPWRGAAGYGHAYAALARRLPKDADTFVLLGTSHAPMREAFALCRKTFATPLGAMQVDVEAVDTLAACARFDPYADQFNHKREHSLEFQAVFLRHLLSTADRDGKIVPILCGLGEHQARGTDPARDRSVGAFLDGVRELVESRPGRVVVIAGADLAHVGPRFGDTAAFDASERAELERRDRASLARAAGAAAKEFWSDVASDLETRRVCGLAPMYTLLRALPEARGEVLHYEQTIDDEDGSIVSHAGVAFSSA